MRLRDYVRALKCALGISFPRRVGSAGERTARALILQHLREEELSPWTEQVPLRGHAETASRWVVWTGVAIFWFAVLTHKTWPVAAVVLLLLPPFAWMVKRWVWLELGLRSPDWRYRRAASTSNILAEVRGIEPGEEFCTVWLLAHYDSKSQVLPLVLRFIAALAFPLMGVLLAVAVVGAWSLTVKGCLLAVATAAALVLGGPSGNSSPGALDNAAAVGLLIALAGHYCRQPPRALALRMVFTGAEELGLLGAFSLLHQHRRELGRGVHLFINLDGLGCGGALRLFGQVKSPVAKRLLETSCRLGVPLKTARVPPAMMMEHEVFSRAGFPSLSLGCLDWRLRHIHSRLDHPGLIEFQALKETGELLRHFLDELDEPGADELEVPGGSSPTPHV